MIDLEGLGVELRVDILGALLRFGAFDVLDRLTLLGLDLRDDELVAAALRLLLLLELPFFRELLAAQIGSVTHPKSIRKIIQIQETRALNV